MKSCNQTALFPISLMVSVMSTIFCSYLILDVIRICQTNFKFIKDQCKRNGTFHKILPKSLCSAVPPVICHF